MEQWFNYIKKVCTEQTDVSLMLAHTMLCFHHVFTEQIRTIESEIGLGQIEEVIEDAKNERWLVDYYFGESCFCP